MDGKRISFLFNHLLWLQQFCYLASCKVNTLKRFNIMDFFIFLHLPAYQTQATLLIVLLTSTLHRANPSLGAVNVALDQSYMKAPPSYTASFKDVST